MTKKSVINSLNKVRLLNNRGSLCIETREIDYGEKIASLLNIIINDSFK